MPSVPAHRHVNDVESCSVCGRTILGGEQTRTYLTPERERRTVCDLCRDRAERVGWVWEELAADLPTGGGRRRAGLASLLRGRAARSQEDAADDADYPEPRCTAWSRSSHRPHPPSPRKRLSQRLEPAPTPPPPPPPRRSPDPAAPGAGIGRSASPAESRMARIENAIERFNNSEESVMFGGLAKNARRPWVSVGAAAGLIKRSPDHHCLGALLVSVGSRHLRRAAAGL